jgi:hypothetical protein
LPKLSRGLSQFGDVLGEFIEPLLMFVGNRDQVFNLIVVVDYAGSQRVNYASEAIKAVVGGHVVRKKCDSFCSLSVSHNFGLSRLEVVEGTRRGGARPFGVAEL